LLLNVQNAVHVFKLYSGQFINNKSCMGNIWDMRGDDVWLSLVKHGKFSIGDICSSLWPLNSPSIIRNPQKSLLTCRDRSTLSKRITHYDIRPDVPYYSPTTHHQKGTAIYHPRTRWSALYVELWKLDSYHR